MVQKEMPFPELAHSSNNSKAMARGKSPTKSAKDLHRHSNYVVGSNEWANEWLLLQAVSLHEHMSSASQWSHHMIIFTGISND